MIRTLVIVFALVTIAIGLSACTNTVRGVGSDLEKAGQEIQKSTR
jgi:predicted small secreted protein